MKRQIFEALWALRRRVPVPRRAGVVPASRPADLTAEPNWPALTRHDGDEAFGYGYIARLRDSAQVLIAAAGPDGTGLRIHSHDAPATPEATHPHVVVDAANLVIDFARIGRRDDLRHRLGYLPSKNGYLDYREGALIGFEAKEIEWPCEERFPRDHMRAIFDGMQIVDRQPNVHRIVDEPVLFISREPRENGNLFHAVTDWLSAFSACRMLDLDPREVTVALMDGNAPTGVDDGWKALFPGRPVDRLGAWGAAAVLFRRAIFPSPGYSSFLYSDLMSDVPETLAPVGLLGDFAASIAGGFGIRSQPRNAQEPLRVTLVARRPGARVPALRQFRHEQALAAAIGAAVGGEVAVHDFAALSLRDQVDVVSATDILVGAHGAALTHLLFLPRHGVAVEVVARPARATYRLFPHMATWSGHRLLRVEAEETFSLSGTFLEPNQGELSSAMVEAVGLIAAG